MANKRITDLLPAVALTGAEVLPTVQAGSTVKATAADIAAAGAIVAAALADSNTALTGTPVVDGHQTAAGEVVLCTGQTLGYQNGPWVVAAGAWSRPANFGSGTTPRVRTASVLGGTVYAGTIWTLTTTGILIVDSTVQTWSSPAVTGLAALAAAQTVRTANTRTANYTLALSDAGKAVEGNAAGALNFTVPPNSSVPFPVGTIVEVPQVGAGAVTLVAGGGVTITGDTVTPGQGGSLLLRKTATDAWWSAIVSVRSGTYAGALIATAVKTANYTAAPKDYVLVDTTAGAVTVTLPTAPADGSRIGIKIVAPSPVVNLVTFAVGGSDHINLTTGPTSGTVSKVNQAVILQYTSSTAVWMVQSSDLPLSAVIASDGAQTVTPNLTIRPANGGAALTVQIRTDWTSSDGGPDASLRFVSEEFAVGSPYRYGAYFAREGHFCSGLAIISSNKRVDSSGLIQAISAVADGSEPYMFAASPDINGPCFAAEARTSGLPGYDNQAAFAAYDLDDVSGGTTSYSPGYGKKKWILTGKGSQYWGANLGITPLTSYDMSLVKGGNGICTWRAGAAYSTEVQLDCAAGKASTLKFQANGVDKWALANDSTDNIFRMRDNANNRFVMQVVPGASSTACQIYMGAIFRHADAALEQTTVGAAGAASALPATPSKYEKVIGADGVTYVVPMYLAA